MAENNSILEQLVNSILSQENTGKSDSIPATIDGDTPASLSEGEYVIPADIVSALGDGSTASGAKVLDDFLKSVRMETSSKEGEQAPPIRELIESIVAPLSTGKEEQQQQEGTSQLDSFLQGSGGGEGEEIIPGVDLKSQMMQKIFEDYRNEAGQ